MTRVTERYRYDSTLNRIGAMKEEYDNITETAASGRLLRKTSDDPVAAVRVMRNKSKVENIKQYRRTIDFAKGYLQKAEDGLRSINDAIVRAKELGVQMSNATYDSTSRQTVAEEIRQLSRHIVNIGNTTYADKYVFGGFRTHHPPISPDGYYLGDDGTLFVQVDEDSFRPININARKVFDVETEEEGRVRPIVQVFTSFAHALAENDLEGVHNCMVELDKSLDRMSNGIAEIGTRHAAIDDVSERIDRTEESLLEDNNHLEGADTIKTALDQKRMDVALQYTLQSSAKILTPSLLNFLRND